MSERKEWESQIVEYHVGECIHCGEKVLADESDNDYDDLPKGVNVVIGGGEHISISTTPGASHSYRVPRLIAKWFVSDSKQTPIRTQYLCPSCAEALYGYE